MIRHIFDKHDDVVTGLVKLREDLVISTSRDGRLFSWQPSTGRKVGEWAHSCGLESLDRLDRSKLIAGDSDKNVVLLKHDDSASRFDKLQQAKHMHSDVVSAMAVHHASNLLVTGSADTTAQLWEFPTLIIPKHYPTPVGCVL